ncbi:MAG: NF038122 family metalloprotease [Cyanobacteria bacterium J06635_13]
MDSGLQFDFTFAEGTSSEQMLAFEIAGMMWSDYITDDMTVNIHVEMTDALPDNVIGGALPAIIAKQDYGEFLDAYQADITSNRDQRSFSGMSRIEHGGIERFQAVVDLGVKSFVKNSPTLNLTSANAKSLGLVDSHSQALDGYILMNDLANTSVSWANYMEEYGTGFNIAFGAEHNQSSNTLDFLSVAVHEVGHILGFVSGVDKSAAPRFDTVMSMNDYFASTPQSVFKYAKSVVKQATTMDLFRYSQASLNRTQDGVLDMSVGAESYFGKGLYYQFATGKEADALGDGFQASHWKQRDNEDQVQGIMDPLLKIGAIRRVSNRDLRVMDAIGYDISYIGANLVQRGEYSTNYLAKDLYSPIGGFEYDAKIKLAQKLYSQGLVNSTDWWNYNADSYFAQNVVNRDLDVQEMIEESEIYEGRSSKNSRKGRKYHRQEAFWQSAYFNEFSWQEFQVEAAVVEQLTVNFEISNQTVFKSAAADTSPEFHTQKEEPITNRASITSVTMDLLTADSQDAIDTVSTKLESELVSQASLYPEQLAALGLGRALV